MQEAGFKIDGEFFPMPTHFTLGDAVLVNQTAGMEFEEFAAQLTPDGEVGSRALIGLVAVAVAHKRGKRWSRDRVAAFVGEVNWDAFENVEGDELPPAEEGAKPSPEPSDEFIPSLEPTPEDQS